MESIFRILAVIFIGIAAFFLIWRNDAETGFIAAILGAVSFFLSLRFQVKGRLQQQDEERRRKEDEENVEPDLLPDDLALDDQIDEQRTTDTEQKANLWRK